MTSPKITEIIIADRFLMNILYMYLKFLENDVATLPFMLHEVMSF